MSTVRDAKQLKFNTKWIFLVWDVVQTSHLHVILRLRYTSHLSGSVLTHTFPSCAPSLGVNTLLKFCT